MFGLAPQLLTLFIFSFAIISSTQAQEPDNWLEGASNHLESIWNDGNHELYIPLYTYHTPYAYSPQKLAEYTDYPMGLGFGKGITNESGNWEGVYGMAFKDSHGIYEYMAGYGWVPMWSIDKAGDWKYGAGVTVFMMSREDIFHYIPFPGALPIGSISYKDLSLQTTYIPGGKDFGNVIFTWAKWSFI